MNMYKELHTTMSRPFYSDAKKAKNVSFFFFFLFVTLFITARFLRNYCRHTGWAKKRGHRLMTIILSNVNRFKKLFTGRFLCKFAVKRIRLLKIPPHLAYVAALFCETLMSAKQALNDKLQGSVAVALLITKLRKVHC